ncbi:hypothetical protein [Aestuariibaculum marinum]|uniref:Uncharacterized protein n=1 Tax=Aestuariibaculum marinum TaxID=2683592 RepID=A0A8J6Q8S6_9FLAO|nr:hypothetical protein [Aestuariibaculum marinum]MBD0825483.1 hypothetical protein [Aestuariibaculum marinum]
MKGTIVDSQTKKGTFAVVSIDKHNIASDESGHLKITMTPREFGGHIYLIANV